MVNKILQAPKPVDKKQLRSFLWLIGYYRKFIPNFAVLAVPLTDLTRKGAPIQLKWNEAQDKAFETLKAYIACPPVLRLPYNTTLQHAALDILAQRSYVRSYLCFFYLSKVIFAVLDVSSLPLQKC